MNRLIKKLKKQLVEKIEGNVNDYDFIVLTQDSNDKQLVVKASNRYLTDVHILRISKLNLEEHFNVVKPHVNKPYVYSSNALEEINSKYELQLTEDDIVPVRIIGDSFKLEIKKESVYYSGSVDVKVTTSNKDLIAYFDNQTTVNFKPNLPLETKYLLRHLTFTYMEDLLSECTAGSSLEPKVLNLLLNRLVNFNNSKLPVENNLFGCVVVENKRLDSSFTTATRVLKLGLNRKLCTNINGILEIYY